MPIVILPVLLAAAALAAPAPTPPRSVSFVTKDGWTISADYRPARKGGTVVILAHGVASSKLEWILFAERLQAEGVGTLAVDLRGHHDSQKGPAGTRTYQDFDATGEWPRAVEDLNAAARWLTARGVPESRIAFGGASIGANLASQAAAKRSKTPFLLLLSPGPDYRGVQPRIRPGLKTYVGASPPDAYAAQLLRPLSSVKGVEIFEAPAGHGTQMFEDKATFDTIVAWAVSASRGR
ncbi:MAG: alpha/beta hydrolase [Elusimicrobiota bacterium]